MLARRFLGCIAVLTLLAVAGAFAMYQFGGEVLTRTMTPRGHYQAPPAKDAGPDYSQPDNWLARPGPRSPAEWRPDLADGTPAPPPILQPRDAATFFIHPTTYLDTDRWNAPLHPGNQTENRSLLFVRSQASVFNGVSEIWAPRYRQAAFGAFLLTGPDATKALDLAYGDVVRAFDAFLAEQPPGRPLILAGHSQGSLHLLRLLADRRDALADRLVAAYVVGWPVGVAADLPATGLPPCERAPQAGCVLGWQTFGSPANPALVTDAWVGTTGLTGAKRERSDILCINPINGTRGSAAPVSANKGTLVPSADFQTARLEPGTVGARCAQGFLIADGELPAMGPFALPGNNFHPFDYALFWGSIRADAERRLAAFQAAR